MIKMRGQRYVHGCVTGVVGPTGNIGRNEQSIICSDQKMINVTIVGINVALSNGIRNFGLSFEFRSGNYVCNELRNWKLNH